MSILLIFLQVVLIISHLVLVLDLTTTCLEYSFKAKFLSSAFSYGSRIFCPLTFLDLPFSNFNTKTIFFFLLFVEKIPSIYDETKVIART